METECATKRGKVQYFSHDFDFDELLPQGRQFDGALILASSQGDQNGRAQNSELAGSSAWEK